ncbi:MAG: putative toxin-antitoxin system toxin component, PIN family [candidate division KSB1 bacterium]|nr:putative toxin-antitoxin system toxin component, PIN family [candidate division KSB1 bacterium]MDZ7303847.1 putative toxin-antitoxin system toxin component, PIN family [candidate division KSB1 bacterium]MDZ7312748.1 putative toxin-antitoxin system toxin component, PIN family [candidate division KSB1 bacterium]
MKAVIDTNVVLAGLANRKGASFKILEHYLHRQFEWVNSQPVLDEYQGVLSVSQKVAPVHLQIFLHLLRKRTRLVQITGSLRVCKDPDDDKFLETAIIGGANFLVTKNLKHFPRKSYQKVRIVTVAAFLKEIEKLFP